MARWATRLTWLGVALFTLVLAHEVVFLAGYGSTFGDVLASTGHDARWTRAVVAVLVLGALLLIGGAWRLHSLGALATALGAEDRERSGPAGDLRPAALVGYLGRGWLALTISTSVLFIVQENAERVGLGQIPPGLAVLRSAEYPNALLLIVAVALAVASVAALFRWRRDALVARIADTGSRWPQAKTSPVPRAWAVSHRRPASILGRRQALRAPPASS